MSVNEAVLKVKNAWYWYIPQGTHEN